MLVSPSFAEESRPAQLSHAILIYQSGGPEALAAATLNPVALDKQNRPQIGPGDPLTKADFQRVLAALEPDQANSGTHALLPENLLVLDNEMMMWWLPSQRRELFFKTDNKQLNADLNGRKVLQPALLFQARVSGGLSIWALSESKRPTAATPLFRAPYLNMYETARLCEGSYSFPQSLRSSELAKWERGFFDTHFSHTNMDVRKLTTHQHGHDGLWREMVKTRSKYFPAKYLAPMKSKDGKKALKLSEVLSG